MNTKLIERLRHLKPIIEKEFGINRLAIFGSQARDDYTLQSDVDIVIFTMQNKNFERFMKLKYFLEKELQMRVDIGFYNSMKTFIKKEIDKELIYV